MKKLIFAALLICASIQLLAQGTKPTTGILPTKPNDTISVRVKDIARVMSARDNQLMGYGLVVGLNGTGDNTKSEFTTLALSNMFKKLGVSLRPDQLKVKNVAAVMITSNIGPFMRSGDRLDITISSLGDATSLQGGELLQTPLFGADAKVYAVAQGPISLGGFSASGGGASKTSGHPTVGRIPGGAIVEMEIPTDLAPNGTLTFTLNSPDFSTSARMAESLTKVLNEDGVSATALDSAAVSIQIPTKYKEKTVELIAKLGEAELMVDSPARIIINERTGTVVIGGRVNITPVALAQGSLTVTINPELTVSQPEALSNGSTVSTNTSDVKIDDPKVSLAQLKGGTVDELVNALNSMKVNPRDIIAILQALRAAGALQAEIRII
jgi:flagellar P-ring protein precursor FlgI